MTRADRFDATDWIEQRVGGVLLIDVAGIVARPLGEDAAGIGRRVERRDAFGLGEVQHLFGVAVGQREAIVRDQGVEIPITQQRHHHSHLAGRQPHRLRQPFLPDAEEFAQGAVPAGRLRLLQRSTRPRSLEDAPPMGLRQVQLKDCRFRLPDARRRTGR